MPLMKLLNVAAAYTPQSMLTEDFKTTISNAGADLVATIKDGGLLVAGCCLGAIVFTVGLSYVLRKIRSIGSQAVQWIREKLR